MAILPGCVGDGSPRHSWFLVLIRSVALQLKFAQRAARFCHRQAVIHLAGSIIHGFQRYGDQRSPFDGESPHI